MNNDFDHVLAQYRKELDAGYAGNIYVEALPGLFSRQELAQALTLVPVPTEEERSASIEARLTRLSSLSTLCIALTRVIDLAQAMHRLLLEGYRHRRPFTAEDRDNRRRLYEEQQQGKVQRAGRHHRASQLSMALFGNPGSGKTYIMRQIANLFPPVIFHEDSGRWQIPFLFLEMPHDGKSMYTLAAQIFQAIEKLMPGSEYVKHYTGDVKINAERLLLKALNIAYELGVGMIVVDEAQNTKKVGNTPVLSLHTPPEKMPKQASESGLMKLLITASNIGHIPLLFTGTMELMPTVTTRASPARRMVGRGSAAWRPLSLDLAPDMPISEFDLFMNVLFRCQWLKKPAEYNADWAEAFYAYTQGIPDYMVKLFEAAQARAIRTNASTMTIAHLTAAFKAEFEAGKPTLDTAQNPDDIMKLLMPDMYGYQPVDPNVLAAKMVKPKAPASTKEPMTEHDIVAVIDKKKQSAATRAATNSNSRSPRPLAVDPVVIATSDLRKSKFVPTSPLGASPMAAQV